MSDPYKKRQLERRIAKNADQSELMAVLRGTALAEDGYYDERVSGATDDYNIDENVAPTHWQKQDIVLDSAGGDILTELHRRQKLLGDAYPFKIKGASLEYVPSKSGFYEYCLAITCARNITTGNYVYLPRSFERLSAYLVQYYLGPNTDSLHVGTPRSNKIGKKFSDAMSTLHDRCGEWFWNPMHGFPDDPDTTGDEGLDFVVWKDNLDGRLGKLFIIGQCACGDDWADKFNDLTLQKITRWFNPPSYIPPVRAFTTPHHLSDMNLKDAFLAGLVFDRARLVLIAEKIAITERKYTKYGRVLKNLTTMVIKDSEGSTATPS